MSNFISFRRCSNASTWDFKRRIMSRSVIAFPCTYNFRCGYRTQDDKCQCVRNTHQSLFHRMIGTITSTFHVCRQCRNLVVIVKIRVVTFIQVDHSATAPARLSKSLKSNYTHSLRDRNAKTPSDTLQLLPVRFSSPIPGRKCRIIGNLEISK